MSRADSPLLKKFDFNATALLLYKSLQGLCQQEEDYLILAVACAQAVIALRDALAAPEDKSTGEDLC